jgi:hypothetical protein
VNLLIVETDHGEVCRSCGRGVDHHRRVFNEEQRAILLELFGVLRRGLEDQRRDRRLLEGYDA